MSFATGLIRRAENSELPLLGLRAIREMRSELDELQNAQILAAREKGASWADIAEALGISRQALQQKMRGKSDSAVTKEITLADEATATQGQQKA